MRDGRTRKLEITHTDPSFEKWLAHWKAAVVLLSGGSAGTEYEMDAPRVSLGRGDEAQALRWGRFERELDAPMLRTFLAKLPDFEDEEALQRALDHAEAFPQPHRALAFLAGWPDLRRAAALVVARPAIWQGDQYAVLAPVAEALAQQHPRAATILYRRLLDSILETGRSAAYPHGARYLAELDALAERLAAGDVEPNPQAYRAALRQAHGRKHGFWSLVRD